MVIPSYFESLWDERLLPTIVVSDNEEWTTVTFFSGLQLQLRDIVNLNAIHVQGRQFELAMPAILHNYLCDSK